MHELIVKQNKKQLKNKKLNKTKYMSKKKKKTLNSARVAYVYPHLLGEKWQ